MNVVDEKRLITLRKLFAKREEEHLAELEVFLQRGVRAGIRATIAVYHDGWFDRVKSDAEEAVVAKFLEMPFRFLEKEGA